MKLFKKFATAFTFVLLALTLCLGMVGCGETDKYAAEDDDTGWDKKTYVVYVYLEDGKTPAKDVNLSLCYNTETLSSCLTPAKTNEDGRVSFTFPEGITPVGDPVIHFNANLLGNYVLPEGYGMPSDVSEVVMNGSISYTYAKVATTKVTKFNLTKLA